MTFVFWFRKLQIKRNCDLYSQFDPDDCAIQNLLDKINSFEISKKNASSGKLFTCMSIYRLSRINVKLSLNAQVYFKLKNDGDVACLNETSVSELLFFINRTGIQYGVERVNGRLESSDNLVRLIQQDVAISDFVGNHLSLNKMFDKTRRGFSLYPLWSCA